MKVIGLALFGGSHLSTHDAEKFGFPVIEDAENKFLGHKCHVSKMIKWKNPRISRVRQHL